jgi:hypothetical protein
MHYEETFLLVPRLLTLWPWSWTLTSFWKNFNLGYICWGFDTWDIDALWKVFFYGIKTFDLVTYNYLKLWPLSGSHYPASYVVYWKLLFIGGRENPNTLVITWIICMDINFKPDFPLPVKSCRTWAYARRLQPVGREGSLNIMPYLL